MGKKPPTHTMNTALAVPIPNHRMAIGIQAMGGMGRSSSMSGSTFRRTTGRSATSVPTLIAENRGEYEAGDYPTHAGQRVEHQRAVARPVDKGRCDLTGGREER